VLEFAAEPQRQFSTAELAAMHGASAHHLAKVLGRLKRARLVAAVRGAGGGYRFSGNAKRVTVLEVIELFERVGAPPRGSARPRIEDAVQRVLAEVDETARANFGSITLETMLKLARRLPAGPRPGSG
jgi:Rrf2 family protein